MGLLIFLGGEVYNRVKLKLYIRLIVPIIFNLYPLASL
jgi:hypothetical protein